MTGKVPGQCYCRRPGNLNCDCVDARVEAAELNAIFRLRYDADMRAIKRWQAAHPGNDLTWPDHADLVVWLMEQLAETPEPEPTETRQAHSAKDGRRDCVHPSLR